RLHDFLAGQRRQGRGSGDSAMQQMLEAHPARAEDSALWAREYQQRLFRLAAEQLRPEFHRATWQAFWQTAVEGQCGKQVAKQLGMTVAAVYLAKSRVMARVRKQVQQLEADGALVAGEAS